MTVAGPAPERHLPGAEPAVLVAGVLAADDDADRAAAQAHFARDFRSVVGTTPSAYLRDSRAAAG